MKKVLLIVFSALVLTACGKRGNPEFPPGTLYPRQYPAPRRPAPPPPPPETPDAETILDIQETLILE